MNITVVGIDFSNLLTAIIFSSHGHTVTCIDTDEASIESLKLGVLPFDEPGIDEFFYLANTIGTLSFSTDAESIAHSEVVIFNGDLCNGTGGIEQLPFLENIGLLKQRAVIVLLGDSQQHANRYLADFIVEKWALVVEVASIPRFFNRGTAIDDWLNLERLVIGVRNAIAGSRLKRLFASVATKHCVHCEFDLRVPELVEQESESVVNDMNLFLARLQSEYAKQLESVPDRKNN